jgi:uncharacterized YigZ family protein
MAHSEDKPVEGRSELDDAEVSFDPDEPYRRVAGFGEVEMKVDRSRFIGRMLPVDTEDEAHAYVEETRAEHHDARHVCFGVRVGRGARRVDRSNDDGEPPRTGGFPIWQVLEGEELTNSLGVVIRYFGGVELGMGGLRRAYRNAAREALEKAGIETVHPERRLTIQVAYDQFGALEHLVESRPALRFVDQSFGAEVEVEVAVRAASAAGEIQVLASQLERDATALETSLEEG